MYKEKIIIVDDEEGMLHYLSKLLRSHGYRVETCNNGKTLMEWFASGSGDADLAIIDYRLPDSNGMQLMAELAKLRPQVKTVIITAYGDIKIAVQAMKQGAADFLAKPFSGDKIIETIEKVFQPVRLLRENRFLRQRLAAHEKDPGLVFQSQEFSEVIAMADKVATTSATVLLTGESGTGKEVVARYIHQHSHSEHSPFLAVNCGALTESLFESQLFGTLQGAYTGALKNREGLFAAAGGGTILLDEIADISPNLQQKLLRVIETKEIIPLGGTKPLKVDVRIIAATNKNLVADVSAGRFREDLFYRLQVFNINIPPLRQRPHDIMPLVSHFLAYYAERENRPFLQVMPEVEEALLTHSWPGNVRELRNLVHRAVILANDEYFSSKLLPFNLETREPADFDLKNDFFLPLSEVELRYIAKVYRTVKGDRGKTSRILGISSKTLNRKLQRIESSAAGR